MNERILAAIETLNNRLTNIEQRIRDNEKAFQDYKEKNNEATMVETARKLDHYTIKDGQWYYDNYPTGTPAQGEAGKPFTYEDFTPEQLEALRGPKGDTFTFDDLTPEEIVLLTGADGLDGKDGKDGYTPVKGVDYFDGMPGKDGKDGKDAHIPEIKMGEIKSVSTFDDAKATIIKDGEDFILNLDIPRGRPGLNGSPGSNGSSATINGMSTLEIVPGRNITIVQEGNKLIINSTGGGGIPDGQLITSDDDLFITSDDANFIVKESD